MEFRLKRLVSYDKESIKLELIRVSRLRDWTSLKKRDFDKVSRVSSSVVLDRFGTWKAALGNAGLAHLYSGVMVTERMLTKPGRMVTNNQMLIELKRVAKLIHPLHLTVIAFKAHSGMNIATISARFGSWNKALHAAGLSRSPLGKRYSDQQCYENLLEVWTKLARPPMAKEMNRTPSCVGLKAYTRRWGSWTKALHAFVEAVESSHFHETVSPSAETPRPHRRMPISEQRDIPLGLRWRVFNRDKFKCVACGSSPATNPGIILHVDHKVPFSQGGKTTIENLQILCSECNLGKGARSGWHGS